MRWRVASIVMAACAILLSLLRLFNVTDSQFVGSGASILMSLALIIEGVNARKQQASDQWKLLLGIALLVLAVGNLLFFRV